MKQKKNTKDKILLVMLVICTILVLGCAIWLINYLIDSGKGAKQADQLKEEYILIRGEELKEEESQEDASDNLQEELPVKKEKVVIDGKEYADFTGLEVPERNIDFTSMQQEVNADIYAWVYVPGTKVDYPILQRSDDNEFYLDHDVNGKSASCGSIYTEKYNNKDFNDNHNVVYGHNMKNGTMFKTLRYYDDKEFFEENKYIYIYTAEDTRVYEIFGAYENTDEHLLLNYTTENLGEYQKYLDKVKKLGDACGHFNRDMTVNSGDKIITLSTCIANKANSRYLVQGKLIAVEKN